MLYLMLFFEGILTFISPCLLPMLPLYLSYFAIQDRSDSKQRIVWALIQFVLGFSLVFSLLNVFVYSLGSFFLQHQGTVNLISGIWMVALGIDNLSSNWFSQKIFKGNQFQKIPASHFLFGIVFAISWTPCVGAYLASALALTMNASHVWESLLMIWTYCLGLALPLVLSALVLEELKSVLDKFKQHSVRIQQVAGLVLIIFGILWMSGYLSSWLQL